SGLLNNVKSFTIILPVSTSANSSSAFPTSCNTFKTESGVSIQYNRIDKFQFAHKSQFSRHLYLGKSTHLKPAEVVFIAVGSSKGVDEAEGMGLAERRDAEVDHGGDPVGSEPAKVPGHGGSPIVPDQEDLVDLEGVEEADQVADDVEGGVFGRRRGRVGVAVPAEVRGDAAVAEGGEGEELVAPRVPELREAVEEEDGGRPGSDGGHVHVDSVGGDG
ncbi:unnamed protein product, partial [Linum tenue]